MLASLVGYWRSWTDIPLIWEEATEIALWQGSAVRLRCWCPGARSQVFSPGLCRNYGRSKSWVVRNFREFETRLELQVECGGVAVCTDRLRYV